MYGKRDHLCTTVLLLYYDIITFYVRTNTLGEVQVGKVAFSTKRIIKTNPTIIIIMPFTHKPIAQYQVRLQGKGMADNPI